MLKMSRAFAFLVLFSFSAALSAAPLIRATVFGPETYRGGIFRPANYEQSFLIEGSPKNITLTVTNGSGSTFVKADCAKLKGFEKIKCLAKNALIDSRVALERVHHAEIKLNGKMILNASRLNAKVSSVTIPVSLLKKNALSIKVHGLPTSSVTLEIKADVVASNVPPIAIVKASQANGIAPFMVAFDASLSTDSDGTIASYSWDFGDGSTGLGLRPTHEFKAGTYSVKLTVRDNTGAEASATVSITATEPVVPADPIQTVPPVPVTMAANLNEMTSFLYSGLDPIQKGLALGALDERFTSVIRGQVFDEDGAPLPGVKITILNSPQYGYTISRADGFFDMAVNGGAELTVNFERSGYYQAQRKVLPQHQGFAIVETPYMLRPDSKVTQVASNSASAQVARGSTSVDDDGQRTATVYFPSQTQAKIRMASGALLSVPELHVRAKEYTVGENGPKRMPAKLPSSSAYTYAVELTADEVEAYGAKGVEFSKPVSFYVDNFLNLPVGVTIPVGIYNPEIGAWQASKNGRVIKVLSVENSKANLDVLGNNSPASTSELASMGITPEEQTQIAGLYQPGVSFWRAQGTHFSVYDLNIFQEGVADNDFGDDPPTSPDENCEPCNAIPANSTIYPDSRTLTEQVSLVGVPVQLNYSSDRVPARASSRRLDIQVTPQDTSNIRNFAGVDLTVSVAGRTFKQSFTNAADQKYEFNWDGYDAYGRFLNTSQVTEVTLQYRVDSVYLVGYPALDREDTFALLGSNLAVSPVPGRAQTLYTKKYFKIIGNNTTIGNQAVAGWTFDNHHFYDSLSQTLYMGSGAKRNTTNTGSVAVSAAGRAFNTGFAGDGGQARSALMSNAGSLVVNSRNEIYFRDRGNARIRKIDSNGIITTVIGNGTAGVSGDGGVASAAQTSSSGGLAIAPDGTLYFAEESFHRIRKISPQGIVSLVAGTGVVGFAGDDSQATAAQLNFPTALAYNEGNLYVADTFNNRIRVVTSTGLIRRVAGAGSQGFAGDGAAASLAILNRPQGLAFGVNGDLYISDTNNFRIRRIDTDGIVYTVAGGGSVTAEGSLATSAALDAPFDLSIGKEGTIYFRTPSTRLIYRVSPQGLLYKFAGTGNLAFSNDYELAGNTSFLQNSEHLTLSPNGDIYYSDNVRVRKFVSPYPGFADGEISIPSSDGLEMYHFDSRGKHIKTVNTRTGASFWTFNYDSQGRLITMSDGDGNATSIERNGSGGPTRIVAPFGQVTNLSVSSDGYLGAVSSPAGDAYSFFYKTGGLLETTRKPKGNEVTFKYDASGQLERDTNAGGGFIELVRTKIKDGYQILVATAQGRQTVTTLTQTATGRKQTRREPTGVQTTLEDDLRGNLKTSSPYSSVSSRTQADPRLGAVASYQSSATVSLFADTFTTTPLTATATRSTVFSPLEPYKFTQTDVITKNGKSSTVIYDSVARVETNRSPLGRETKTYFDPQGRVTQIQVPAFSDMFFQYNNRGQLATAEQGGRVTTFGYNSSGYMASKTNALNQTTNYSYDSSGRVTQTMRPDGKVIKFNYDANGNLTEVTPPSKPTHFFNFNVVDLAQSYLAPLLGSRPNATQYAYTLDRQLASVSNPSGLYANYTYNQATGQLSSIATASGSYTYNYDSKAMLSNVTSPSGVLTTFKYLGTKPLSETNFFQATGSISYAYDSELRLASSTVTSGSQVSSVGYLYDNDDLLTRAGNMSIFRRTDNGLVDATLIDKIFAGFQYNNFGEISTRYGVYFSGSPVGDTLFGVAYTRDNLGRIIEKGEQYVNQIKGNTYTYDLAGRLTHVTENGALIGAYVYDENGNRISATRNGVTKNGVYDDQDRLLSYGSNTYQYTDDGNLLSKAAGSQTTQYNYDVFGNLRSVALPNGTNISYVIDGFDRRVGGIL